MINIKKKILFSLLLIVFLFLFLELVLTSLTISFPKIKEIIAAPWESSSPEIPDARLGNRPNPEYFEHDSKGFRNPAVPRVADIVALGDSQTYGTGVKPSEAWPRQLESISGRKVYGMAFGGWGPAHSLILWDEAAAFKPKIIIEAVYSGNDLYDCFNLVYNLNQFPELKTSDARVQDEIRLKEKSETITHRVEAMFSLGVPAQDKDFTKKHKSLQNFVTRHSKLYGLLRRARYEINRRVHPRINAFQEKSESEEWQEAKESAKEKPQYCEIFDDGRFKTIFTPAYRLTALNLEDPRILEGQQILLKAIEEMNEKGAAQGIRFMVVLIPTKELVFSDFVKDPSENYKVSIANEEKFLNSAVEYFKKHNIEYVEALPALKRQLAVGHQPFQVSRDGHPNPFGHRAIAELVNRQIQK